MSDAPHDHVESLLGAYALDAVDPDERDLVDAHLESCPRCRAEVDAHREVAAALGNSVDPVTPELWDRVAAAIRSADSVSPPVPSPADLPAPPAELSAVVVPLPDRARPAGRRRVVAWVAGVAAAAAVAVIAVLSVGLSHANDRVHQLQSATAAGSLHGELSAALANPAHQVVALRSPTGTVVAHVVLVPGGQAYLTDVTMPALAADETYQLWGFFDGRTISLSLLGHQPRLVAFSLGSATPNVLAVTAEPAGGVVAPTGAVVAQGQVVRA